MVDRTRPPAGGAGELRREGLGLLLQEGGERAVEQSAGGGDGDPFQGGQVGVEAWAGVAEGASGHDLAPAGRHITDILEFFGGEWRSGHALPCLGLAPKDGAKFSSRCRAEHLGRQSRSWPRLLVAVMDPVGDYTQILYNLASEQIGSLDMNGGLTRTPVNAAGQFTAVIDADGNKTQYIYDGLGRQTVSIDPLGDRTTTTYDAAGNVSTMTDADNREQVFHYWVTCYERGHKSVGPSARPAAASGRPIRRVGADARAGVSAAPPACRPTRTASDRRSSAAPLPPTKR